MGPTQLKQQISMWCTTESTILSLEAPTGYNFVPRLIKELKVDLFALYS